MASQANTALDNVLAQAAAAAEAFVPPSTSSVAVQVPTAANNNQALAKPSLSSLADSGGMVCDEYLSMVYDGFRVGNLMKGLVDDFTGTIDLSEVTALYTSRHSIDGAGTTFLKSYDGVTTVEGANFLQEVNRLTNQPGAKSSGIYQTVEVPVTLTEAVADPKKDSSLVIEVGAIIGVTPPKTGVKEFVKFQKELAKQGIDMDTATVKVKVVHVPIEAKGNKWAVAAFELIEEVIEE